MERIGKTQRAAACLYLLVAGLIGLIVNPPASAQTPLQDSVPIVSNVGQGEWEYYFIDVYDWNAKAGWGVRSLNAGNADIYVRLGSLPDLNNWDYRSNTNKKAERILAHESSAPPLESGRYYVGIYGKSAVRYGVGAKRFTEASSKTGMGSIPYSGGTTFRVWAPNATKVYVAGDFNGWSQATSPLVSEGNGNWSVDFRNATINQQYKYVIWNGSSQLWKNDARAQQVTASNGNTVIADPRFDWTDDLYSTPAWNDLVIYEMHVGTFNDTYGGLPGDFDNVILKLDYLQDLGINAIEVMPVNEFPGDFSWGYNMSHPFAIESVYGGSQAYKRFVNAAHVRGIAILQDVVFNHYGPTDLDLWQYDGWHQNFMGGIFFYNDERASTPWGDTRPDYGRSEVRQYIRDNSLFWLEDYHADGLRVDGTSWIRSVYGGGSYELPDGWSLMQWINNEVDARQGWKFIVAEDMQNNAWMTKTTGAGGAGFDSQWSAQFVHPIRSNIITSVDSNRNMWEVRDAISQRYNSDAFERIIFTESHDEVANGKMRVPEEIWPGNSGSWYSRKRSTLGAALVMTSPGVPMIFQGQEILENGYFADNDPIDWSKLNTYSGIHTLYSDLIKLRRNWYDNTRGLRGQNLNVHHVNDTDKVIAFHRWDTGGNGDDVIVILNMSNKTYPEYIIGFPSGGTWQVRFNSDSSIYSGDYGNYGSSSVNAVSGQWDGMPYNGALSIGPYSAMILSKD